MGEPSETASFASLLQELELAAGSGLDPVIRLAAAVQRRRQETGASSTSKVTRTAALIAIGALDSATRSQLEKAGLDWGELQSAAKLSKLPAPAETADGVAPHDHLDRALHRFAKAHPGHPVIGAVELALAIVDSVAEDSQSGLLPERLVRSGLDVAAAKIHIEELHASAPAVFDLQTFLQRDLAVTTISGDADEAVIANLQEEEEVGWGVGPALRENDFVLMYVPAKLVRYLYGSRPGFYALYRVALPTQPSDDEEMWRHYVDLVGRLPLNPPITIDEMREDEVLRDWHLLKANFRDAGLQKEPVGEREKRALGELILRRVATLPAEAEVLRSAASIGDEPATKDLLGRQDLVEALAAMLDHPSQGTPFTIGLLGDWGSGKTTVMKLLEGELAKSPLKRRHEFTFAWFNAWQYEKTGNLAAGLAQETVNALVAGLGPLGRWWLKIRFAWSKYGWRFAGTLVWLLVWALLVVVAAVLALAPEKLGLDAFLGNEVARLFSGTFALGLGAVTVRLFMHARELWSHPLADRMVSYLKLPDYAKHLGLIPVLHRHLRTLCELRGIRRVDGVPNAVGSTAGSDKPATRRRLVVFVDDLDRCAPRAIVGTFDAIRLVMVIPEVVLIVGVDARIAFRAVGSHYRTLADDVASPQDIARDFLGKIIQLPIRLGQPNKLRDFVQRLFASSGDYERSFTADEAKAPRGPEGAAAGSPTNGAADSSSFPASDSEVQPGVKKGTEASPRTRKDEDDAARAAIRVELDRDMEHSAEESEQFEALAEIFDIYNPRKLLRLRNSYRLLKLLDLQLARRAPEHDRFDPPLLMASLFWQEFLFACTPTIRKASEEAVGSGGEAAIVPDARARKIVERFLAKLDENPDWRGGLDGARDFVRRLVLPRGDTWTTRTPGANAETTLNVD